MAYAAHGWGYLAQHYNIYGHTAVTSGRASPRASLLKSVHVNQRAMTVSLTLNRPAEVTIELFDIGGRVVYAQAVVSRQAHTYRESAVQEACCFGGRRLRAARAHGQREGCQAVAVWSERTVSNPVKKPVAASATARWTTKRSMRPWLARRFTLKVAKSMGQRL